MGIATTAVRALERSPQLVSACLGFLDLAPPTTSEEAQDVLNSEHKVLSCTGLSYSTDGASSYPVTSVQVDKMARGIDSPDRSISSEEIARIIRGNVVKDFERLRPVPGFQLDPVSWETVKALVAEKTAESLGKLGRAPSGSVVYWRFRDETEKEYASVADYMQKTVFDFETELTPEGRKKVIVPTPNLRNPTVIWRPNDFPYNFEEGVEHHNIWSTVALPEARVLEVIGDNRKGFEYVWFTNPLPLASIPTVWHAHIISRPVLDASDKAVHANGH